MLKELIIMLLFSLTGKADLQKYDEFKKVNVVHKKEINFVLKTYDKTLDKVVDNFIPISDPEELWNHAAYKKDQPLVIYISGYLTNLEKRRSKSHDALTRAFVKFRPDINFVVIITQSLIFTVNYAHNKFFSFTDYRHRFNFIYFCNQNYDLKCIIFHSKDRYLSHWFGSYHKSAVCTLQLADHLTEALKKFLGNHASIVNKMQIIGNQLLKYRFPSTRC